MVTSLETAGVLKEYFKQRDTQRLSMPALETLAIITYKQPVTRLDIESLRGVNVDGVIKSLLEKNMIRITGKKISLESLLSTALPGSSWNILA